jgi:hypothetical protein
VGHRNKYSTFHPFSKSLNHSKEDSKDFLLKKQIFTNEDYNHLLELKLIRELRDTEIALKNLELEYRFKMENINRKINLLKNNIRKALPSKNANQPFDDLEFTEKIQNGLLKNPFTSKRKPIDRFWEKLLSW